MAAVGATAISPSNVGKCLKHNAVAFGRPLFESFIISIANPARHRRLTVAMLSRRRRTLVRNRRAGVASLSRGCREYAASRARSRRKSREKRASASTFSTSCRIRGERRRAYRGNGASTPLSTNGQKARPAYGGDARPLSNQRLSSPSPAETRPISCPRRSGSRLPSGAVRRRQRRTKRACRRCAGRCCRHRARRPRGSHCR